MVSDSPEAVRFLSQEAAIEAGATDANRCVERMDEVFELYDDGRVVMGENGHYLHGHMTTFPDGLAEPDAKRLRAGSRFGAMPAYVGGDIDAIGVKWYGSVTARPDEASAPDSDPILVLSDPDTGRPLTVMDGAVVSSMRTGATAALGARYLQGDRATTATILGPGSVGQASTIALDATLGSLAEIRVYHPDERKSVAFRDAMQERVGARIAATDSIRTAVRGADVTVAAASGDSPPRIDASWLDDDSTVIQLGDLRIDLGAFDTDRIFCDVRRHPLEFERQVGWEFTAAYAAAIESDEYPLALSDVRTLHELASGTDTEPTAGRSILSSLGLPMEDVAWGAEVYRNATAEGLGQPLSFRSESHFGTTY
ncbi:hypothetical protein [Halorubrum laminariae]|uniref:Ornithine cyclodeaminase n=1 Tax=Halorubrum laminariae TaxID=1433523 RepID=A0ABD6C651_9EURY|nr:hypothetical protein [Halorubrum laminariae]